MLYLIKSFAEIEMELQESDMVSRAERKKELHSNTKYLVEKRQREWLIKHGKGSLLDFQDE